MKRIHNTFSEPNAWKFFFLFARETVSDLSNRGGFPPLLLNPVNFDALFAQALQQQEQQEQEGQEEVKH